MALISALPGLAQQEQPEAAPDARSAGDVVEAYMERLGLKRLQAEDLARRLESATGGDRLAIAERLAKLYVVLLSEARTAEDRRLWEGRSEELLRRVPEANSFELRLSLTKTLHLQATETVERQRLRLAAPEEVAEAERVLRSVKPQLDDIAQKTNRRVETLEQLEERGETSERLSDELADARRVRSQAFYYLGWTNYYLAYLSGSDELAFDSLKSFGWLLNSPGGRIPALDRILRGLFKYEHIARAAAGCALATALRGNHVAALAWLDSLEEADDLPAGVRANLVTWRIAILTSSKRWADLERYVRLVRNSDWSGGGPNVKPLDLVPARLLAVTALEADDSLAKEVAAPLAAIALGDLVSAGEIAHVLDLVQRYGSLPLGEEGFIANYVRGIQQYEKARRAHKAAEAPGAEGGMDVEVAGAGDRPTSDTQAVSEYRLAATLFRAAVEEEDAESFKVERAKASQLWGFCLFYSGELERAAERFGETARIAATPAQSEEALWLAVLALDQAVEDGEESLAKRRDEAAALFLQMHPDSAHAPKLILRRAMAGVLDPEESVRILMGVEKDSAMYGAARQHAARLLYQQYRTARGSDRDFAAMRFVGVAEETLNMDRRVAMNADDAGAKEAAERIVARVRQILDALLGTQTPDPARAEAALEILAGVSEAHSLDLSAYRDEMVFRRLQIALARDDITAAAELIEQLQAAPEAGTQFSVAADQLMYKRAVAKQQRNEGGSATLREIVHYGGRLIERMMHEESAMTSNVVLSLHQVVAAAATELWRTEQDASMRDLAIKLDERMLGAQARNQQALRRLASNADAAGDAKRSLDCWRTLVAGLEPGTMEWFEARYESIRLLAALEPTRAKQAIQQHVVLYPDYAPEPWGSKLKKLEQDLASVPAPGPAPAPGDAGGPP